MTFGEAKRQILNLGFEVAAGYEEEPGIMTDAINRAMRELTNHFPLIGSYSIVQEPVAEGAPRWVRYDFRELTREGGDVVFIDFLDMVREDADYSRTRDFRTEQRHLLVLDGRQKQTCAVFYSKNFAPVTPDTPDACELPLDFDREHLLPLLAAWYVWADDEPTKAEKWRNDYEDFLGLLLAKPNANTAQQPFLNGLGW